MVIVSYIFGFIAIICLIISFQINDGKSLFKYQIISSFSSFFQYLLIGSLMGAFMNLVAGIRNFVFRRYNNKIPLCYSFALWTLDLRLIRLIDVLASILFLIYDVYVFSVTGFILHFLEMCSSLVSIYRFDIRSCKNVLCSLWKIWWFW